jgi:hypothetical protein
MKRLEPVDRHKRHARRANEKTEEANCVATAELDDQPGHARQEIGEGVFAAARESGKIA